MAFLVELLRNERLKKGKKNEKGNNNNNNNKILVFSVYLSVPLLF